MTRAAVASVAAAAWCLIGLSACAGTQRAQAPVDDKFGHRHDEETQGARQTIVIAPAEAEVEYFYYPAYFDTVHVRHAPFEEGVPPELQELPVEVLLKGSLPDSCTELHDLEQDRAGNIIDVTLRIRKPRGTVCAAVMRPYRFYFELPGEYRPGHYTLRLNNRVVPFQIKPPPGE